MTRKGLQTVGIYACGPTVYGRIHIGNARPFVIFTLLRRFLAHQGLDPKLVVNVTDVNDKIYDAAREAGRPSAEFAAEMTAAYIRGHRRPGARAARLRAARDRDDRPDRGADRRPDRGAGTPTRPRGDVYYRVRSFDGYGKLSNRDPEQMDQGEEAGTASLKEDPLDFALWKATKEGEDTSWDSPWGRGRPGWHIECSAMAEAELGPDFAIHGGGIDLVFPHHENEIAQTEAARGVPLARIWMHNGMVQIDEEKMSKSEGNIFQLSEATRPLRPTRPWSPTSPAGHYRQPLAFSDEALEEASSRVEGIRNYVRDAPGGEPDPFLGERREEFLEALADDFNTPRAFAALAEIVAEGNRRELPGARGRARGAVAAAGPRLAAGRATRAADPEAERLLAEREAARAAKDFERADAIRDQLAELGWEVRDGAEGARLVRRG